MKVGIVNLGANNHKARLKRIATILKAISQHYGYTVEDIIGTRRWADLVWPRHAAMSLAREEGCLLREIAEVFNREHQTVINACRSVRNLCETEPQLAREYERLKDMAPVSWRQLE
jgi:chromosomal replication initiator protein